jgi:steroid 5-alpha reductase family enzyme
MEPAARERRATRGALLGSGLAVAFAILLSLAGSSNGLRLDSGLPVFAACALLAFGIQWLAFLPAYLAQSERYYDLLGAATYLTVVWFAASRRGDPNSLLLALLISLWALRLGTFLFLRIRAAGSDRRFERIKPHFFRFLQTWTLQGLWVVVTAGAALAAMTSAVVVEPGPAAWLGGSLWLLGFAIEVVADAQKRTFRRDPGNRGRYISSGLWAWSRHPNYFGEILLWSGVALIAAPALQGAQLITLVSPLFVYLLLTRVSGVPMLEAQGRRQWGDEPGYQRYLQHTPRLLPRPPRRDAG